MFNSMRITSIVVVMMMVSVWDARAQTDSRLAVGASITGNLLPASDTDGSATVGFEIRIGHERPGWGPQTSIFGWFDTAIQKPIATSTVDFGNLRLRPIMAGYGYTWIRGRRSLTADVVGGYSLNSLRLDSGAVAEYAQRLGATSIESEATNAFAVKPEIQVWYDLNPRFGLKLNAGYLISRPSIVIRSSLGEDVRPIRADTFLITVGVVYSLF